MLRISDHVSPLSREVIMRMLFAPYCWQIAYIVPPPSIATAGSPTKLEMFGIETFSLQVSPPSLENENAHTRSARSSIQPASTTPSGPAAIATSVCRPLPESSLSRTLLLNTTSACATEPESIVIASAMPESIGVVPALPPMPPLAPDPPTPPDAPPAAPAPPVPPVGGVHGHGAYAVPSAKH